MLVRRDYEALKFELAGIIRAIPAAGISSCEGTATNARELLARLAEDRFQLAFLGRFSRGKTTLMNAILGVDWLPTGILPVTSAISIVTYGSRERARIEFESGGIAFDVGLKALPDYVSETRNPGNMHHVRAARIELPAEILRSGVSFLDTPGLGSSIPENTRTTERLLPEADAAVVVSGYDAPLSEEEVRVAREFVQSGRPVVLVLNKRDLVSEDARGEVERYTGQQLREAGIGATPYLSLSATQGLTAKLTGATSAVEASGLAHLEHELSRFLSEEKDRRFLRGICTGVASLLVGIAGGESLQGRLAAFRQKLEAGARSSPSTLSKAPSAAVNEAVGMTRCVVCVQVHETVRSFLLRFQRDLAMREDTRAELAELGGLCSTHWHLYSTVASDRDTCVGLTPVALRVGTALRALAESGVQSGEAPVRELQSTWGDSCPVCEVYGHAEERAICAVIGAYQGSADVQSQGPPAVCLPHLRAIANRGPPSVTRALAERQAVATQRLTEDMQRYALKRDGLRSGLTTDEETQAARRVIAFLAGEYSPTSLR
ncbi:MAG TPA: dynamin family protein [Steroidobacteraceae bacterium]|nr:dynamin family protein [Steroidobacteraceae bacterium]